MKERIERIKQFLTQHQEAIFFTSMALVGACVGAVIVDRDRNREHNQALRRVYDGGTVDHIERLHRADGVSVTLAHARNGRTFRFDQDQ